MQKLWLKNFEFGISPNTWNTAQDLVQAGAVRQLQEIEKHFWVTSVREGDMKYEVEVMITPYKIKAYTCECWEEGRRLMCAHVAAGLLKIRQFLEQQKESRERSQPSKKEESSGRLSVPTVLNSASQEDLQNFVSSYARRDRDFALALKTWFAGKLTGFDNPFLLAIDAALPRHGGAKPMQEPELRRLRKVLDELNQQINAAGEKADAVLVFQIATAILEKVSPILLKLEDAKKQRLEAYLQQALSKIIDLPPEQLSPELRDKRRDFLFEQIQADQQISGSALIYFLSQLASDDVFFKKIRDLFDRSPSPTPTAILHLFISALARRQLPQAIVKVLQDYTERPIQIKAALDLLYRQQLWEALLLTGTHFLDQEIFNSWQQREIEDWLLIAAEKSNDPARRSAYLRRLYRNTASADIYQRLKERAGPDWPNERKLLIDELQKAGNTLGLANLFAAEKETNALVQLLENQGDLSLLQQFEEALLPQHRGFVHNFYVEYLSAYLGEHFGLPASNQVQAQLKGLIPKGQLELVKAIVADLVARFPDRQGLSDELAEIFPKFKRGNFLPT